MKTYRLEKDLKWNYGIRIQRDYATMTGKRIDIFCFKMIELPELGAMFQIKKGFWFSFVFAFNIRIERWFKLSNLGGNISAINVLMIHPCGFKITDQRYREIVSEMTTRQLKETTYE